MPIYEYTCASCGNEFELLVRSQTTPACPACDSQDLERRLSLPRVHSASTRAKSMRAAKARDARQGKERMQAQKEYELSHDDH